LAVLAAAFYFGVCHKHGICYLGQARRARRNFNTS